MRKIFLQTALMGLCLAGGLLTVMTSAVADAQPFLTGFEVTGAQTDWHSAIAAVNVELTASDATVESYIIKDAPAGDPAPDLEMTENWLDWLEGETTLSTTHMITSAQGNTALYAWVKAEAGEPTGPVSATIVYSTATPDFNNVSFGEQRYSIRVSWQTDTDAIGWVEYREGETGDWLTVGPGDYGTQHSMLIGGLSPATEYQVKLHADNAASTVYSVSTASVQIPTNSLALWLDASEPTTLAIDTGGVSQWRDTSGNERHAAQATDDERGTLLEDALGGKSVVDFGTFGSNRWMSFARVENIRTMFWVIGSQNGGGWLLGDSTDYHFSRNPGGASASDPIWASDSHANVRAGQTFKNGTQINGQQQGLSGNYDIVSLVTFLGDTQVKANQIARDRAMTDRGGGQRLGELIIYERALTEQERKSVEEYLAFKWGLESKIDGLVPQITAFSAQDRATGHPYHTQDTRIKTTIAVSSAEYGVTGYMINENPVPPGISDTGWEADPVDEYDLQQNGGTVEEGFKTIYAWIKDGAGSVRGANDWIVYSTAQPEMTDIEFDVQLYTLTANWFTWDTEAIGWVTYREVGAGDWLISEPGAFGHGLQHFVEITGLTPGTDYELRLHADAATLSEIDGQPIVVSTAVLPVPTDGLMLWLDADDAETFTFVNDRISEWRDKSPNERHANQATAASRPALLGNALGGKPVVDFGVYGSGQWMNFGRLTNIRSVFWVIGSQHGGGWLLGDSDWTWNFHRGAGGNGGVASNPLWGDASGSVIGGQTRKNGILIDGVQEGLSGGYDLISLVTTGNTNAAQLAADRGGAAGRTGGQSLGELLIYDRALTAQERESVEEYLAFKWGLQEQMDGLVPLITTFDVYDQTDGNMYHTQDSTVACSILTNEAETKYQVEGFIVNENPEPPGYDDAGWEEMPLLTYDLEEVEPGVVQQGMKNVYAWIKDSAGLVRGASDWIVYSTATPDIIDPQFTSHEYSIEAGWTTSADAICWIEYRVKDDPEAEWLISAPSTYGTTHSFELAGLAEATMYELMLHADATAVGPVDISTAGLVPIEYELTLTPADPPLYAGVNVPLSVTLENVTTIGYGYDAVLFSFEKTGPGDVTFTSSVFSETNSGYFPDEPFELPVEYSQTTPWTLVFSQTGEYTITFRCFEAGDEENPFTENSVVLDIIEMPVVPEDGMMLWLDADDADTFTLDANNKVEQWRDKSGNDRHATQGTAASRGTLLPNALGGKPVVDFSTFGSNQWMSFAGIEDIRTVFWVIGSQNGGGWLLGDSSVYDFSRGAGGASASDPIWAGDAHGSIKGGQTFKNDTQVNGTTTGLSGDYDVISLVTTGNVRASQIARDRGMPNRGGGQRIGELLIYNRALTPEERQSVAIYLALKWGLDGKFEGLTPQVTSFSVTDTGVEKNPYHTANTTVAYTIEAVPSAGNTITGYMINENPEPPGIHEDGWLTEPTLTYELAETEGVVEQGMKTIYAWVKDSGEEYVRGKSDWIVYSTAAPGITGESFTPHRYSIDISYNSSAEAIGWVSYREQGSSEWLLTEPNPDATEHSFILSDLLAGQAYEIRLHADTTMAGPFVVNTLPIPIPSDGLVLWLDADDAGTITFDADNRIQQWRDKSPRERHANQTTSTRRGVLLQDELGGKPVVDFGVYGSDRWMDFNRIENIRTVFWVIGSQNGGGWLLGDSSAYDFTRGGGGNGGIASNPLWMPDGNTHINIRSGLTFLNGEQINGTTTGLSGDYDVVSLVTTGDVRASQLTRDRSGGGGRTGGQRLGELIIYNRALTPEEREAVEQYLEYKWISEAPELSTYAFSFDVDEPVYAGEDVNVEVTLATDVLNNSGYDLVGVSVDATGPGDVTITKVDTELWDGEGFALPADYLQAVNYTLNFSKCGEYTITFSCYEIGDEENPFAQDSVVVNVSVYGDANLDRTVDLLDLVYVRNRLFSQDPGGAAADITGDGTIGLDDLIEVRNNLGAACE